MIKFLTLLIVLLSIQRVWSAAEDAAASNADIVKKIIARKAGVPLPPPDMLYNREVTLSDAEVYFYKNIFKYLEDKFKVVDSKLASLNSLNKTVEALRLDVSHIGHNSVNSNEESDFDRRIDSLNLRRFRIFSEYDVIPQFHDQLVSDSMLFKNTTPSDYYTCLSECEKNSDCLVVVVKPNECHMYSSDQVYKRVKLTKTSSTLNQDSDQLNLPTSLGLTYYWPISNHSKNVITGSSLNKETFVRDIVAKTNSALRVTGKTDYLTVKEPISMGTDFTVMLWARVNENRFNEAIFDFGNGQKNDNILFYLSQFSLKPSIAVYNRATRVGLARSAQAINLNEWYHFAITLNRKTLSLYVNGVLVDTVECSMTINDKIRNINYFGRSSWKSGDYANVDVDQIKIFNRTLAPAEIHNDMLNIFVKFYQKDIDQIRHSGVYPKLNVYTREYDSSLVHYWPISGHAENMITGISMEHRDSYVNDRFNISDSAIRNTGEEDHLTINEELQLSSHFTIMLWVRINENKYDQAFFDFGNGENNDNIVFYLSELNMIPVVSVYNQENKIGSIKSDFPIALNKWYHYTIIMNEQKLSLYVNGALVKTQECSTKLNDNPKLINYIGRSSWISGDYASADFDEIKIFNRALSQQDINNDMFNKYPYIMEV